MLIEDDSDRGEIEVIENEVLDKVPIDARFELPGVMNKSAEEEIVIDKEHLKCENENIENEVEVPRIMINSVEDEAVLKEDNVSKNEDNEIERMVEGKIEWVSEILKSELSSQIKRRVVKQRR